MPLPNSRPRLALLLPFWAHCKLHQTQKMRFFRQNIAYYQIKRYFFGIIHVTP